MQKVYFETPGPRQDAWNDLKLTEFALAVPLVALILWIGIYPAPMINVIQPATAKTIALADAETP